VRLSPFAFIFRSRLPDVLSRSGFDKKFDLMSPLRCESCYGGQRLSQRELPREVVGVFEEGGMAHSEVQGKRGIKNG